MTASVASPDSDNKTKPPWIVLQGIPPQNDFTKMIQVDTEERWSAFLVNCSDTLKEQLKHFPAIGNVAAWTPESNPENNLYSVPETVLIKKTIGGADVLQGRALICLCNGGRYLSITIRILAPLEGEAADQATNEKPWPAADFEPETKARTCTFKGTPTRASRLTLNQFAAIDKSDSLCGFDVTVHQLRDILGIRDSIPQGLLIISGTTNSGKSNITRGLIWAFLESLLKNYGIDWSKAKDQGKLIYPRHIHMLSLEDPIETPVFAIPPIPPLTADTDVLDALHLDCTMRELGKDARSIGDFLHDALRQTPSVVYIGEVRDIRDWKPIFDFAGTGHFIIATTHAGTLTETFNRLFQAVGAVTPADKGSYAQRLLAVISLREVRADSTDKLFRKDTNTEVPNKTVLPALWLRTPNTIARLISDGLSALLPIRSKPPREQKTDDASCYGRASFAHQLEIELGNRKRLVDPAAAMRHLITAAIRHDIRGE